MTAPKFRAWFGSEMYDKPVVYDGEFYLDWRYFENEKTYDGVILMQSTGVHDANGKEIFESDVVSWIDAYGILHFGVVEFTKGMFLVNGDEPVSEAMEVIGNIYEHPDLVED